MDGAFVVAVPDVTIRVEDRDGTAVVSLDGEVDIAGDGAIRAVLDAQFDRLPAALVLDLTRVRFFGSTGVDVVVVTRRRAARAGMRFAIAAAGRRVLRVLEITGVDAELIIRATAGEAVAAVSDRAGIPRRVATLS
ncbi:STAS domain-containing protein [Actinosynnema sp. NPDC020468]|uniref:STAS domain-containing protein n=1 Tax=Actinosynnema sp. NPDC020468 TaxID=3154488 RepID=UPI00340111B5